MENKETLYNGWKNFCRFISGAVERVSVVVRTIFDWCFRLRKIFMALPVLYFALEFARKNMEELPEVVGFNIQSNGEFAQMISRETAVYGPLALTLIALVLMLCSRRTVYPWLISIFTLVLPLLILVLNTISL